MVNETLDKHLYANDCSQKLPEAKEEFIERESIEPDEVVDYIIQKYQFQF